jgi:hypothetical protein
VRQGAKIGAGLRRVEVNGQPGALFLDAEGKVISVMSVDIAEGQVRAVRSVINPDKLRHLGEVSGLTQRRASPAERR